MNHFLGEAILFYILRVTFNDNFHFFSWLVSLFLSLSLIPHAFSFHSKTSDFFLDFFRSSIIMKKVHDEKEDKEHSSIGFYTQSLIEYCREFIISF